MAAGEETMMDSKRIEELRALVFASMPAVSRKGQPSQQQKEEKEESKEEGELSSEEENPTDKESVQSPSPFSSSAMGTTLLSAVTTSVTTSPAHTKTVLKQKEETLSVSVSATTTNVEAGFTIVSLPSITPVERLQVHTDYETKGAPTKPLPSEGYGFYADSQLVSQHPATAPRFGCVQKEAEKFSMSLHAPLGSLHGERTDSLVIKFSDEDSDSDAELQQTISDQIRQNNSENQKLTGEGLFSGQSANLSNQSTISLKSEINRMKRQIASIEQVKRKHRRLSKSSAILASQQDGHQISKATIGHQISVSDLEILRQQIAIKENELQQRKQQAAARSGSGNKISCTGSVSVQGGYPLNPESRNKASLTVPSVAKTSLGKSTEQELLSCKYGLGKLDSSEIPAVARPIISSEEIFQDSLLVSSTLNAGPQEIEASESKRSGGPGASFPESSENLLFASCQHELRLSPSTSLKGTVLFTDLTSSKVSLPSTFKHMHSNMEETGAGVKKQRLNEPSSRMQPHSCSDEKSSLDDPSRVNLKQGHVKHAHLLSSSNSYAEIDHVGATSNQGSHPISNCKGVSNSMQVVSSPSESVEPSPAYQLDGGANSCKEGLNQRIEEATFTSHVEYPTSMVILSENCQDMQKLSMAGSPEAMRYPFGLAESQAQNSRLGIAQGASDQEIEFGTDEIRSLMEEEELIDKELEEAQQDRFNCESIERLARRKHRESLVNLQLANMRCNILYQKRESLAARIQAAETQYFTNRASICLPIQHHQGILVPHGCNEDHAKRSFWSGKVRFLNELRKSEVDPPLVPLQVSETHQASAEVYRNSESGNSHLDDSSMVSANDLQAGLIPLAVPDIVMASKGLDQQQGDSAHHTRTIVPQHPAVIEIEEDHNTTPNTGDVNTSIDVVSLKSSINVGRPIQQHKDKSKANLNSLNQPSVPLDSKAADLSSNDRNPERIIVQNNKTLLEMLNSGVAREPLHGFSSASFAMNTDKMTPSHLQDSTGVAINNGHGISNLSVRSNVLNKQSSCPPLIGSSTLNQIQQCSDSLENSLQSTVHFRTMANFSNVFSAGAKMEEHHMQFNLSSGSPKSSMKAQELQNDSCNLEEDHNFKLHKILDKGKSEVYLDKKILTVEAAAHVGNTPAAALSADCGDCHKALEAAKISLVNVDNLSEGFTSSVGVSRKVMHDLKKAGLQKSRKNIFNESADDVDELEEPIKKLLPTKLKSLFSSFQGVVLCRDENSKSSEEKDLMCCPYLNPIATSVPSGYISPLTMFRSYRICPQFSAPFNLPMNSDSWSHSIDPFKPMCKFEHRGKCNNDDCPWQHKRDYTLSPIQLLNQIQDYSWCSESQSEVDEQSLLEQNNRILESSESTADALVSLVNQIDGEHTITRPIISGKFSLPKWSRHLTKPPVYRIGSYIIKGDDLLTLQPVTAWAQRSWKLGFCQSFSMPLPIYRQLPLDMPCLLNSLVTDALLGSTISSALCLPNNVKGNNRLPAEAEEQLFKGFEDVESLLELSLNLIDFKVDVETFEACKHALYILSRVLETYPNSAALWIVYLHIYHLHGKSIAEEDMFLHAVLYNKGSYVLWLWFINSRKNLRQKLEAFQMAITELGNKCKDKEFSWNEQSSFLLDISLQMLNFMCMSGLISEAIGWINDLISCASKTNELHTSDKSLLLSSLSQYDACILWICCGYVIAHKQLPDTILKRLGCKQRLPLGLDWEKRRFTRSCKEQVMMLMQTAASHGRGCLAVEVVEGSFERESLAAKQVMVVNFIECAIACDVDNALATGKMFMELYPTSVELVLACVHLAELHGGKRAGLDLFENAICQWPRHKPGILRLWSQYIAYAYAVEGKNPAKALLEKCASQIEHNHPCISVSRRKSMLEHSDDVVRQVLQSLPSIVNHKFEGVSTNVSMPFSDEDVVFGSLILAFSEVLNGDFIAAQIATNKALGSALNEDDVHHCLKEVAALTVLESGCIAIGGPKMLCLLDKWSIESRLLTTLQPLSRMFSDSIKKRRVRLFVENLLGPPTVDYSFLNSILEICYGPLLVPEDASLQEVFNFVEGVLELVPANVPIAAATCKIVHQRFSKSNLTIKTAGLLWSISLLTNALCQSAPSVAESLWLESGNMLEQLGADSFLEDFYQIAIAMCPLSTSLWHRVLAILEQTGKLPAAAEAIKENGSILDLNIRN